MIKAASSGETKYGLSVDNLQENIQITENAITGKLKKITSYPQFSSIEEEQSGHYLALDVEVPEGAKVSTKVEGGTNSDYVDLTSDKFCVYRIKDTSQKIKIKTQKDGKEVEKTYDLTELNLDPGV